jgi:hypothetical protein
MSEFMKEFIEVCENNPQYAYDFIIRHGHEANRNDLHSIIFELLYAISDHHNHDRSEAALLRSTASELVSFYDWE